MTTQEREAQARATAANREAAADRRRLVDAGWMWTPAGWMAPDDRDVDGKTWCMGDALRRLDEGP